MKKKALEFLEKSAEQKNVEAIHELMNFYYKDNIENFNTIKLIHILEEASNNGYLEADYKLGMILLYINENKAFEYFFQAAKRGCLKSFSKVKHSSRYSKY